jgi:hypothetical protein
VKVQISGPFLCKVRVSDRFVVRAFALWRAKIGSRKLPVIVVGVARHARLTMTCTWLQYRGVDCVH